MDYYELIDKLFMNYSLSLLQHFSHYQGTVKICPNLFITQYAYTERDYINYSCMNACIKKSAPETKN